MVFGIFWTAIFSVVFFCTGMFFRVIASAICAFLEIVEPFINLIMVEVVFLCGIALVKMLFLENFKSLESAILIAGLVVLNIIFIAVLIAIMGGITKCIYYVFAGMLGLLLIVVQAIAVFFEDRYIGSIKALVKQVDKQD